MKIKELRKLDGKQLTDQLREARLELAKERAASEIGTVKNPGRIRAVRKTIARIQTIVNTKRIAGESKTAPVKSEKKIAAPAKPASAVKLQKK